MKDSLPSPDGGNAAAARRATVAPPRLARMLLAMVLAARDRRFALADIDEELEERGARDGALLSRRWYRAQVCRSLLPSIRHRLGGWRRRAAPGGGSFDKKTWGSKMPDPLNNISYALRTLAKEPLIVVVTVLSLGLGIAVATTIFTVANAFLLRPPTVSNAALDELVTVYTSNEAGDANGTTSFPDYESLLRQIHDLGDQSALGDAMAYRMGVLTLSEGDDEIERLIVEIVTGNYFDVLGLSPALGRGFLPEETRIGSAERLVVISHDFWARRFDSDPAAIGRRIRLDSDPFTIIGVAPEGLTSRFLSLKIDAWVPLGIPGGTYHASPQELADRGDREYAVMARLRGGYDVGQAQARADVLADALHGEYTELWNDDLDRPRRFTVLTERESRMPPDARTGLSVAAGFVFLIAGMVLFIACSNVAGLFLARANKRGREMAVRLALGASRGRLVRLLLTESLLLGLASGALGVVLARRAAGFIESVPFPLGIPLKFDFSLDHRVLLFALLLSVGTSVVFGLAPALQGSKPDLVQSLKTLTGATGRRPGRFGLRNLLVIGQVGMTLAFLVTAALGLRGLQAMSALDMGINPERIATTTKWLNEEEYPGDAAAAYFDDLRDKLMARPDVEEVHYSLTAELSIIASVYRVHIQVDGYQPGPEERLVFPHNAVTPGYLEMLEIELLRGRTIRATDRAGAPRVAVVNEVFVERYWSGSDGLGKRFYIVGRRGGRNTEPQEPQAVEIVGVVPDANYLGFEGEQTPFIWLSIAQDYNPYRFVHIKGRPDGQAMAAVLREELPLARREVSLIAPMPYSDLIGFQFAVLATTSRLLGYCAIFGLLLACIGIYGIVSFAVSQRGHEIAVRQAVGAMPAQVVRLVLSDGMFLAACGVLLGLLWAVPLSLMMEAELADLEAGLSGLSPIDPVAVGGSTLVLLAAAFLASLIPARRVTKFDPMRTLRQE